MNRLILIVLLFCPFASLAAGEMIFIPTNPPAMRPIVSHDTPAYRAAKLFQHGVNLGNYLEVPPGQRWAVSVSADDFVAMHQEGFDHVRVPVGWHHYAGPAPECTLSEVIFGKADFVVTNALKNGLAVIINIHHFDQLDTNPAVAAEEFIQIWRQVAAHYKDFPEPLAFELDNEPHSKATTAVMNPLYSKAISEIRKTNPRRTIFVEPGNWGNVEELNNLILPGDDNIIVSFHCYDPFVFTHQGANWTGGLTPVTNIVFPGPPQKPLIPDSSLQLKPWVKSWIEQYNTLPVDKNPSSSIAFKTKLKFAHDWSEYYGRPVHLGEFGAYTKADDRSRANFYTAVRREAEKQGIGWAIWDWNAGFRYWDPQRHQPMPGMHDAMFGK